MTHRNSAEKAAQLEQSLAAALACVEKAEIQLEQMGDLLKAACDQRDYWKSRVKALEGPSAGQGLAQSGDVP